MGEALTFVTELPTCAVMLSLATGGAPSQAVQARMAMLAGAADRDTVLWVHDVPNPVSGRGIRHDGAFGLAPLNAVQPQTKNQKQGEVG